MRRYCKLVVAVCLSLGLAGVAAAQQEKSARRLESVTWNPNDHKLVWTVSQGSMDANGKFKPGDKSTFEIEMDAATMSVNGEHRRFSSTEAVNVHALMDLVAKYAADSTVWWFAGEGEPIDPKDDSKVDRKNPHENGTDARPRRKAKPEPPPSKVIRISFEQ